MDLTYIKQNETVRPWGWECWIDVIDNDDSNYRRPFEIRFSSIPRESDFNERVNSIISKCENEIQNPIEQQESLEIKRLKDFGYVSQESTAKTIWELPDIS